MATPFSNPPSNSPVPNSRKIAPSDWKLILNFFLTNFNRVIDASFRNDIDIDSQEAEQGYPNWSSEQQMKYLCRVKPSDNGVMILLRMFLFMFVRVGVFDPREFIALPVENWQRETVINKPQIQLKFFEKTSDQNLAGRSYPLRMIVSWRLQGKAEDYSYTALKAIVQKINLAFPRGKAYDKARTKFLYDDPERGYSFKLLLSEADAKEIIAKVMGIQGHTPDFEENLRLATKPDKNWSGTQPKRRILNQQREYPNFRPLGKLYLHSGQYTAYPMKPFLLFVVKNGSFISEIETRQDIEETQG